MNAQFHARALELAVTEYNVLRELGDPVTPAAFGIAVSHLQVRLNLSLIMAAELLRIELDRLAALKLTRAAETLLTAVGTASQAQDEHDVLRSVVDKPTPAPGGPAANDDDNK